MIPIRREHGVSHCPPPHPFLTANEKDFSHSLEMTIGGEKKGTLLLPLSLLPLEGGAPKGRRLAPAAGWIKAEGKGCILAATHCGNWEMEGAALALYGYPLLSVAMKQNNEEFDRFLCEYRSMPGQTVEYKTGVRDMLRRLKEGYFVGLLCDQDPGDTGILSDFFGEKTLTATVIKIKRG